MAAMHWWVVKTGADAGAYAAQGGRLWPCCVLGWQARSWRLLFRHLQALASIRGHYHGLIAHTQGLQAAPASGRAPHFELCFACVPRPLLCCC